MMRAISAGNSGLISVGGGNCPCCTRRMISRSVGASNGRRPVTIRYSIVPTENRSERASSSPPDACSGDMNASLPLMIP